MKMPIYAVRDIYTGFMTPMPDINDDTAKRNFVHAVRCAGTVMNSHPADYDLYCLGSYDTDTGELLPAVARHLLNGRACMEVTSHDREDV